MATNLYCWNCGSALDQVLLPVSRHEFCPGCAEAVHCCRMCRHYDALAVEQCREDRAEPPNDKTTANFCEHFEPRIGRDTEAPDDAAAQARARLDELFGGDPKD